MTFAEVQQGETLTVSGSHLLPHRRSSSTPRLERHSRQRSAVESKAFEQRDLRSGNSEGERAYSQWGLRRRGLHQRRDKQRTLINRQLSSGVKRGLLCQKPVCPASWYGSNKRAFAVLHARNRLAV